MEYFIYSLIATIPLILILYIDRKNLKNYVYLGILAMIMALVFEELSVVLGFWEYYSLPKIINVSIFTIINYFHYLVFCYFAGNKLSRRFK